MSPIRLLVNDASIPSILPEKNVRRTTRTKDLTGHELNTKQVPDRISFSLYRERVILCAVMCSGEGDRNVEHSEGEGLQLIHDHFSAE